MKLFNNKIEPSCSYCVHGNALGDGEIMCCKKGVVPAYHRCRLFSYEPLKRMPETTHAGAVSSMSKEDFEL